MFLLAAFLFDTLLAILVGGPFRSYQLRLCGVDGSTEYDTDSIQDEEQLIGVLCFCQNGVRCAELLCYWTRYQTSKEKPYNALGFHCFTAPEHRGQGLNKTLQTLAVCLLPFFKRIQSSRGTPPQWVNPSNPPNRCTTLVEPFFVGCQSINPISFHIMKTHIGCTLHQDATYRLNQRNIYLQCGLSSFPLPKDMDTDTVHQLDQCIRNIFDAPPYTSLVSPLSPENIQSASHKYIVRRQLREQFRRCSEEYIAHCGKPAYIALVQDHEQIQKSQGSLCTECAFTIAGEERDVRRVVHKRVLDMHCRSEWWRKGVLWGFRGVLVEVVVGVLCGLVWMA